MSKMKFDLGRVVITSGANVKLEQNDVFIMIRRHVTGDWGELCDDDKQANEDAAEHGDRILSKYIVDGESYYVITEWDRSVTTILLTSDY